MEELLKVIASHVALGVETIAVVLVAVGSIHAAFAIVMAFVRGERHPGWGRAIWVTYGGWLLGGLQFALAADIVRSAIAPSWEQIGQLAAIAAIRTFLSYFLERDLKEMGHWRKEPDAGLADQNLYPSDVTKP
jgi:uncharacterized membrane protein